MTTARLHYEIDGSDRICAVGGDWDAFVRENECSAGLLASNVVGRSLWGFVTGDDVQALYRACFALARKQGRRLRFGFRCDSPTHRRSLLMRVAAGSGGSILLSTITTSVTPWDELGPLELERPERSSAMVMCGLCRSVRTASAWIPVDEWARRHGPTSTFQHESTRFTVCHSCSSAALAN